MAFARRRSTQPQLDRQAAHGVLLLHMLPPSTPPLCAQGRSWLAVHREKRSTPNNCFLPKRWIHSWSGHSKGVNAVRFFPGTGHVMLSAGVCAAPVAAAVQLRLALVVAAVTGGRVCRAHSTHSEQLALALPAVTTRILPSPTLPPVRVL